MKKRATGRRDLRERPDMTLRWLSIGILSLTLAACKEPRDREAERRAEAEKHRAAVAGSPVFATMEKLATSPLPTADGTIRAAVPLTDDNTLITVPDAKMIAAVRSGTGVFSSGGFRVPYHWHRLDEVDGPLGPLDRIKYIGFVKTLQRIEPKRTTSEAFQGGLLRGEAHFFEIASQTYLGGVPFAARSSDNVRTDNRSGDLEANLTDNANWALHDAVARAVPGSTLSTPNRDRDLAAIIVADRRVRSGGASFMLLPGWEPTRDPRLDVLVSSAHGTGATRRVLTVWRENRAFDHGSTKRCNEITAKRATETEATKSRGEIVTLAGVATCIHSTLGATSFDAWGIYPASEATVFARCSGPATDTEGMKSCASILTSWQPDVDRSTRISRRGISIATPPGWSDRLLGGNQIFSGTWTSGGTNAELMVRPLDGLRAIDTDEGCKEASVGVAAEYRGEAVRALRNGGACIVLFHRADRESMVALFRTPSGVTMHAFCDVATVEELADCRDLFRSWRFE
jgi:hypothetical protein